jgi:choline dehydrogenase
MIDVACEAHETLLDQLAIGRIDRRTFASIAGAAGLTGALTGGQIDEAIAAAETQTTNREALKTSYDYIIVGAGVGGSVMAGELAKSGAHVLVVESGPNDDAPTILNPSVWFYNVGGALDYALQLTPVPQLNNRKIDMALGHVLGGGSSINAMVWARGLARDYDGWAQNGAGGWAFKDILPVFKAQEDWEGGANEWRGVGGPVHIRQPHNPHPTASAFLDAAKQMGFSVHEDLNGPRLPGAAYVNQNIAADGSRVSAARAFLRPVLSRPNVTLLLNSKVLKVTFTGKRATGVRVLVDGAPRDILADKEVILSAGGVQSAKVLMLSGVGEAAALRPLGIDVVENLPGVGHNLQDHILLHGVVLKYTGKMPARAADCNATEALVFLDSGYSAAGTDISLVLEELPSINPDVGARFGTPPADAFTIAPALVQPTSRGQVRLASADPADALIIDANFLSTDQDLKAIVRAIEAARELGRQSAFDPIRESEVIPGPKATPQDILDLARTGSGSFGHAVGTCKMGVDPMAVADPQLRVHGLERLRVVDSSVIPHVPTAPTNASTFMVGGRAAQLIQT